ncbi:hypothetical protein EJ08DRAFT_597544 [Tothia fuscella]|uniref:WD repeat protein n=1 Tax=Tothia fuscella TaxID=1048955 RepID=A0A9P4NH92_9PEZI|nr:hypothetical protein EJ08DRAFT_597544 [Tothia fuscella]
MDSRRGSNHEVKSAFQSTTFDRDVSIRVNETVGSASIAPSGRDIVLASAEGLHIIDLDSPYSPPRHLSHQQQWPPADVQWSPFASRAHWIVSTSNQKALVWNLELYNPLSPIEHTLHAHSRAITDINFSAHHPDMLATCAVDSYVHCWDLRRPVRPVMTFADWTAGATQVKWNRQDEHILASSHDKFLKIWDERKGAHPLKTIEAHTTKIYGIDWNRTRPTGILTCSLDKSIKFWDYSKEDDAPERVIRTTFPVWRARHTPFGWGVLALPQRGDYGLHLYDRRLGPGVPRVGFAQPVHSFQGHHDNVKEFLWRSRGDVENGADNRDFQLISWGMDRDLHLHRIDPELLRGVGHEKGKEVRKNMPLTRKGALYVSYRDYKPTDPKEQETSQLSQRRQGYLGALVTAAGMSKMPLPMAPVGREAGTMTYSGRNRKGTINPIKWMEGVTMGSRQTDATNTGLISSENPEGLSNEMTTVSQRYTKVNFEKADVHGRSAIVTLNGPWGPDDKSVFMRINFEFPVEYPSLAPAACTLERTATGISEETMARLYEQVKSIVDHYHVRKTGSLEAVITYLLGERGLEESITIPHLDTYDAVDSGDETSSDEDVVEGEAQGLETSATDNLGQANVPLPKGCGAYWANDGRLVCFFPPKAEPKPLFSLDMLRTGERGNRNNRHFEGFGRFLDSSPSSKRIPVPVDRNDDVPSDASWTSSSSGSDDSDEDISRLPSRFQAPKAWRAAALRFQKTSSHSSGTHGRAQPIVKPKSIVSIHDLSDLLPAKFELAKEYRVFGKGPEVCAHNAEVAHRHGHYDLAAFWEILGHLLYDEVPLEIMEQTMRKEPILVLAKRNIVRMRRKDSGLDLAFDEPASVSNPKLTGRVKWGKHPLGSAWLIPQIFEHYEQLADIQMLAMLVCMLDEPAAREGVSNAVNGIREEVRGNFVFRCPPMVENPPIRAQDNKTVVGGLTTPIGIRSSESWDYFGRIGTYGSAESSNGPWAGDLVHSNLMLPSGPQTPYSTGNTPPAFPTPANRSRYNSTINSLSTSPEQHQLRPTRRTNSNLSAAFSSFSRPFAGLSSSPTTNDRFRSDADISTSAPATAITTYSSSEGSYHQVSDHSDDETTVDPLNRTSKVPTVKVTLKNQHLFDEEHHASVPLLPPDQSAKYAAYREIYAEQLSIWGLYIQRAEVLKFNGLTSYWPSKMADQSQQQQDGADKRIDWSKLAQSTSEPVAAESAEAREERIADEKEKMMEKKEILEKEKRSGESVDMVVERLRTTCRICNERISGVFVKCVSGVHKVHRPISVV